MCITHQKGSDNMDQALIPKILAVQKKALEDPKYQVLLEEHDGVNARFLELLPTLSPAQRDAALDYFGLCHAMHLRLLELALKDKL